MFIGQKWVYKWSRVQIDSNKQNLSFWKTNGIQRILLYISNLSFKLKYYMISDVWARAWLMFKYDNLAQGWVQLESVHELQVLLEILSSHQLGHCMLVYGVKC